MTVVAIDGPAGAGKGTVARAVARRLGFDYLDTGALYRAVTLAVLERGADPADPEAAAAVASSVSVGIDGERVTLDGRDVSEEIRAPRVTAAVPMVSAHPPVRASLLAQQRAVAEGRDVVIEGRDIGAVVVPAAEVKVFLTASEHERARRRALQMGLDEDPATLDRMRRAIGRRDAHDAGRDASPFRRPPDAHVIDSTGLGVAAVVDEVVRLVEGARRA